MAQGMKPAEKIVVALCVGVFILVVGHHFIQPVEDFFERLEASRRVQKRISLRNSHECLSTEMTIVIEGGHACRGEVEDSVYLHIFDHYPATSSGREAIYRDVSSGNIDSANLMLANVFPIDRYDDFASTAGITWDEGLVEDTYWQYLYYGFRPLRHLFSAFDKTLDPAYLNKVYEIVVDFAENGATVEAAWSDSHAVAFRSMFLIKAWWQLREYSYLRYNESAELLRLIEQHADFLEDPNNYEGTYNHAINQGAALYLIASNFPQLDSDGQWARIATDRLSHALSSIVDEDGVLIENSPYYHLNSLEKFWQIYEFSLNFGPKISDEMVERMGRMVDFSAYILRPDRRLPLLGASIQRVVNHFGIYVALAESNPNLLYVLTEGRKGRPPTENARLFADSGLAIMRSGWKRPAKDVHVTFDVGVYRTNHSDFDALTFTLFANGIDLVRDAGLYTYEGGEFRDYFHGTRGHNTILVDGKDQRSGDVDVSDLVVTADYSSLSAHHNLYAGVSHTRSLTLIQDKYLLIIDYLASDTAHEYRQLFHFPEGFELAGNERRVVASHNGTPQLTIHQLDAAGLDLEFTYGQIDPIQGFCADDYGTMYACYVAEYVKNERDATFVTLLEIGRPDPNLTLQPQPGELTVSGHNSNVTINYEAIGDRQVTERLSVVRTEGLMRNSETTSMSAGASQQFAPLMIVFDDGYGSILPAAELMHAHGIKGNIGVIADRVDGRMNGYLDLPTLIRIQEEYGWNMANHSRHHVPASVTYSGGAGRAELEVDITSGARFLIENGINTAPNWYIYPFSSWDDAAKEIVGSYYQFARTTKYGDASYPFENPLQVSTISSDAAEAGGTKSFMPVATLISGVTEFVTNGKPVIVTFHRIRVRDSDEPGYPYTDFEEFIEFVATTGIPVLTLSEFDALNGVDIPTMNINYNDVQIDVRVEIKNSGLSWLRGLLGM